MAVIVDVGADCAVALLLILRIEGSQPILVETLLELRDSLLKGFPGGDATSDPAVSDAEYLRPVFEPPCQCGQAEACSRIFCYRQAGGEQVQCLRGAHLVDVDPCVRGG